MQLFYQPEISKGVLQLNPEESRHCIKVLRKREGDKIVVVDGYGSLYEVAIVAADPRKCTFTVLSIHKEEKHPFSIHIGIAPTKNIDRIEWFLEKAVELGIDEVTFLQCDHSERVKINEERLWKKAVSAMKQSVKASLPRMNPIIPFEEFAQKSAAQKFIAHVDWDNPGHLKDVANPKMDYLVMIGPEGDFSTREIEIAKANEWVSVSLGKSRLRTETAGLAACHILNLINE